MCSNRRLVLFSHPEISSASFIHLTYFLSGIYFPFGTWFGFFCFVSEGAVTLVGFHWCRGGTRLLSAFKKTLRCQGGMRGAAGGPRWVGVLPWKRCRCGLPSLHAAVGSLIYPVIIWEGGLLPFLRCQSLQTHLPACCPRLFCRWFPNGNRLRGLTVPRAGQLGFGLPAKRTELERIPAVSGESLLSGSKRTMVWGKDTEEFGWYWCSREHSPLQWRVLYKVLRRW